MGVLISNDGNITLPCLLLLAGVPLTAIGRHRCNIDLSSVLSCEWRSADIANQPFQWTLGIACLVLCATLVLIESGVLSYISVLGVGGGGGKDRASEEDEVQAELMATHYPTLEILEMAKEMARIQTQNNLGAETKAKLQKSSSVSVSSAYQQKYIICLNAMALKVSMIEKQPTKTKLAKHHNNKGPMMEDVVVDEEELYLIAQEISFIALRTYPSNDLVLSSALSLLALLSKHSCIRKQHLQQNKEYSTSLPIRLMQDALLRAKEINTSNVHHDVDVSVPTKNDEEEKERIAAELQRKGCLYLGALADGDVDLASNIVHNDGLVSILGALDWFQCHVEVVNWGLWATFNLCYDHLKNKGTFVQLDGIGKVIRAMSRILDLLLEDKDNYFQQDILQLEDPKTCQEVAMHGIAILFDVLRLDPSNPNSIDSTRLKRVALNAGVHDVLIKAMTEFPKNSNIMMMGQQLLLQTGYSGEVPCFEGALVRA